MKRSRFASVVGFLALASILALPAPAQVKDYRKIKYPPLPEFKIAEPEVYVLENGLTVFLLEDHELPLVSVRARIRTGSYYEPADKIGLADLMATVQRTGGTARMSGDEIDDYLAVRAATVETSMGGSSGFASMSCLTDAFDDAFAVFVDILREPAFAEDRLGVAKVQANSSVARRNDSVGSITAREFSRLVYGEDSPLASQEEYATIAAVTREDLVAFHEHYYHPNNIYLGVVGDFDSERMKSKIATAFGDWPKGPGFNAPEAAYRKEPNPGVYFIEKSDVNQANIRMGHLGIERTNPDYFAVQVLNEVLGGGFSARMFSNVRSEKGLAYNVFGSVGASFGYPGLFQVGLQTKSETMSEAVDALRAEITGIIDNPPSDDEMKRAKESILNSFVFRYDSRSEILGQQMTYAYHGLPADYLEKYRESIEKVSKEDVERAAKKYIHPDQISILVVGKAEDFDKPVSTYGEVAELDISIPPPPVTAPKITKTAESLAAGTEILARMSRTIGGDNPGSIHGIRRSGSVQLSLGAQSMSMGGEFLLVFPGKARIVLKTPMGEMTTVLDGEHGFRLAAGQVQELPATQVNEATKELERDLSFVAWYQANRDVEAIAAGKDELDGTPCEILAITIGDAESRLWIDADGRVLKQAYVGNHPIRNTPGNVEVFYSDYRTVDGTEVPHQQTIQFEGQQVMKMTFETVDVNPEVADDSFAKPEA